jgi:hypothetical protein
MESSDFYEQRKIPSFVAGLTGENAPSLIKSLGFPGMLRAHSIPGCNAAALAAISTIEKK